MPHAEVIDDDPNVAQLGVGDSRVDCRLDESAPRVWATLACLMLGTSAVFRTVQDQRHMEERNYVESCPFPLKDLPRKLGPGDSRMVVNRHWTCGRCRSLAGPTTSSEPMWMN